ncbi:MAG: hypothetical protein RBT33_02125 [Candidatus Dojkabacteria bacterium]|jgi:hypothetical protein|nr:hypothetical protein [Candidatus Dojkabacteria bacterium]
MKRLPKIKIKRIDFKYVFNYLFVIILTSLILVAILISLPLTERVSSQVTYDLKTKSELYWAKDYTLQLDIWDRIDKEKILDRTTSTLYKRLSKYGVEKIDMYTFTQGEMEYINIHVQSSMPQEYVDELIRSPFIINIVTRNPDIDFEDPENPYAIYLQDNYLDTEFTRDSFRNIYVTKLKNSANEYSYFALFKTWPWNSQWKTFLEDYQGIEVGVSVDGFVTPVQIPTTQPIVFALPISTEEKEEAKLINLLYNTDTIPEPYTLIDEQQVPIEDIEGDYIKILEGVLLATIVIYAYLLLINKTSKKTLILSALSTVITISLWVSYLKIMSIPTDIFLLTIEILAMIAILRITTENSESKIVVNVLLALIASLVAILGTGYAKIFASDLFVLLMLGIISQQIAWFYTTKVKNILKI